MECDNTHRFGINIRSIHNIRYFTFSILGDKKMKNLAIILSTTSLLISGALCYGAYVTYQKAQKILDNPEEFVGAVVEKQVSKAFEKLPIPKLNTEKFKLPF